MSDFSPVALFTYNRPWHTLQTITALQKNDLAKHSELFIFSDGSKSEIDREEVQEVREYLKTITGFKKVTINERSENVGLAQSIISGVTEIINKFGTVIVLEDDLVTSPFFLRYMNDALKQYADTAQVMHISGYAFPIGELSCETFFFRVPMCWGWATWDRAWKFFLKSNGVMSKFNSTMRRAFSFDETFHYWKQLEYNKKGIINTWFIYWYAGIFLQKGLALFPSRSLVANIGFDGTGTHCGTGINYVVLVSEKPVVVEKINIAEEVEILEKHRIFFKKAGLMPTPLSDYKLPVRIFMLWKRKFAPLLYKVKKKLFA